MYAYIDPPFHPNVGNGSPICRVWDMLVQSDVWGYDLWRRTAQPSHRMRPSFSRLGLTDSLTETARTVPVEQYIRVVAPCHGER